MITAVLLVLASGLLELRREDAMVPADAGINDAARLVAHIVHAPARLLTIPTATHFVHLDRPERGRPRLLSERLRFLSELGPGAHTAR